MFEEDNALAPEAASEDDEDGARLERLTGFGWVDGLASLWNRESECALRKTRCRRNNSYARTFLGAFVSSAGYQREARSLLCGTILPFPWNCAS